MYTVLVCDDDVAILDSVEIYLKLEGYNVLRAENGRQAIEQVTNNEVHCVILDIMMPGMDGLQATLTLRKKHNIPIILLSAKSEDTDKITGLSFGADDYVTKPFNPLELMARVKSQIRRYTSLDGEPIKLTATEYGIMRVLMENLGRVLSTGQIYEAVWNEPAIYAEKTVTVHIRRIREKIEINPRDPKYLKVVWDIGYKIEKY